MIVLGIETSCDETAAAVVADSALTPRILSDLLRSQLDEHTPFGGVVPEIAARAHLDHLGPLVRGALAAAHIGPNDLDGVAAAAGPGLIGGLIVGTMMAKGIAWAAGARFIAVNHLEAHALSVRLMAQVDFPYLLLLVSGGHCQLLACLGVGRFTRLGTTLDDAAGEAFDKVAKLLGLGYPGGPVIDQLSVLGDPAAVKFPPSQIKHPDRRNQKKSDSGNQRGRDQEQLRFDFSYSGIKTAVLRYVELRRLQPGIEARRQALARIGQPKTDDYRKLCDRETLDLVASFQCAMVEDLVGKTLAAAQAYEAATLFVTGGVAANQELRRRFQSDAIRQGLPVYFPSRALSTDNAAMIAAAAYPKFLAKDFATMDFSVEAGMQLRGLSPGIAAVILT